MKIMHFILDGYNPSNCVNLFDDDKIVAAMSESRESEQLMMTDLNTYTDGTNHLVSNRMWFRYYGRYYPTKDEDENGKLGKKRYSSMYSNVPGDQLIWRLLAQNGVPSYVHPYNSLTSQRTDWLVGDKNDPHKHLLNGVYKNWYSTVSWELRNGEFTRVNTPFVCSALMPFASNDSYIDDPKFLEMLSELQFGPNGDGTKYTNEDFSKKFSEVRPIIEEKVYEMTAKRLGENKAEYMLRIIPGLKEFTEKYKDTENQYVHIAIGETDCMYHFRPYESVRRDLLLPYMNYIMTQLIKTYKPDVLLISGDHNMVDPITQSEFVKRLSPNSRLRVGECTLDGVDYHVTKPSDGTLPLFLVHGYVVGGRCYFYEKGHNFVNSLSSRLSPASDPNSPVKDTDDVFPEYLYDELKELKNE